MKTNGGAKLAGVAGSANVMTKRTINPGGSVRETRMTTTTMIVRGVVQRGTRMATTRTAPGDDEREMKRTTMIAPGGAGGGDHLEIQPRSFTPPPWHCESAGWWG